MSAFLAVVTFHLLALMAPGPDFLLVTRNSLSYSRTTGMWTALGIAFAVLVHVAYSLLGIGVIISQSILLFNVLKYVGAAYLIYLGVKSLLSKGTHDVSVASKKQKNMISSWQAFKMGFLCNVLNPKATLAFLSLFTIVIDPDTTLSMQLLYSAFLWGSTFIWFTIVSCIFGSSAVQRVYKSIQLVLDRTIGVVLIGLGLKVAMSSQK